MEKSKCDTIDKIFIEVAKKVSSWIIITDENARMIYVSDEVSRISGYKKEELIGENPNIFRAYVRENDFYEELWNTILQGKIFEHVFVNKAKDGRLFYIDGKIVPVEIDNVRYFVSVGRDITSQMKILKELEHVKNKDLITGFYNYETFKTTLEKENPNSGILIVFRINNLSTAKHLNDISNYHKILKHIASKVNLALSNSNTIIGRLSEDEFVAFIKDVSKNEVLNFISDIANKLMDLELSPQVYHGVGDVFIKLGVSVYKEDGTDIDVLCRKASVACSYDNKDCIVSFFNEDMEESLQKIKTAESLVLEAFEKNQFCFYLQPYYKCDTTPRITGYEALIRIVKDNKVISPYFFIDYLEHSKHLRKFEEWSLEQISYMVKTLKKSISLNISARSFADENFIHMLLEKAQELYPFLTVEITERIALGNIDKTKITIKKLKDNGAKIALDDFGTGYSSLNYLKELNADILKIDISFVKSIETDKATRDIVEILILMAKKLNMTTIAEGVETKSQLELLNSLGCKNAQGYYLCKPIPFEEAKSLIPV